MSDFPRGWTFSNFNNAAGAATITIAAVPGVVHVLDGFTSKLWNNGAGAVFGPTVTLTSSDGVFAGLILATLIVPATTVASDSASESGLDLAAGPGASLTLAFSGGEANTTQLLVAQGHDI